MADAREWQLLLEIFPELFASGHVQVRKTVVITDQDTPVDGGDETEMGGDGQDRLEIQSKRRGQRMSLVRDEVVGIDRIVRLERDALAGEIVPVQCLQVGRYEIVDVTFRADIERLEMVGRIQGCIEVEIFVSCPEVELEAKPVDIRVTDLEQVVPEGGVHVFLPVVVDIGIVIVEHIGEIDVAQWASLDGIVQPAISPFADTPSQGDLGVITCLIVVGDVKQGGDNILTVETDAHVDGAVGLVLHLEDQVPVLVADQFVVDVPVGVGSDQDRDGVLELLYGQVAVLFQATDF